MVQKIPFGQTFTNILNLRCDLDLERSNPIFFPQDTPAYDAKFDRKRTSSLEDMVKIVVTSLRDNTPPYQVSIKMKIKING